MSNEIRKVRETIRKAFDKDSDFEHGYVANIACSLHDNNTRDLSWKECNVLAKKVVDLVFRDKR